jgi:hypothetical protein
MSSGLAACLQLQQDTRVLIRVAVVPGQQSPPPATSVQVEPLGPSDWEVVAANAGHLEDVLLAQVSHPPSSQALRQTSTATGCMPCLWERCLW